MDVSVVTVSDASRHHFSFIKHVIINHIFSFFSEIKGRDIHTSALLSLSLTDRLTFGVVNSGFFSSVPRPLQRLHLLLHVRS
jgi:hypothetical protein